MFLRLTELLVIAFRNQEMHSAAVKHFVAASSPFRSPALSVGRNDRISGFVFQIHYCKGYIKNHNNNNNDNKNNYNYNFLLTKSAAC